MRGRAGASRIAATSAACSSRGRAPGGQGTARSGDHSVAWCVARISPSRLIGPFAPAMDERLPLARAQIGATDAEGSVAGAAVDRKGADALAATLTPATGALARSAAGHPNRRRPAAVRVQVCLGFAHASRPKL